MSLYAEKLPDMTIQWYADLRCEVEGRIDGLLPEVDLLMSDNWIRAFRIVEEQSTDGYVLLDTLVHQYFKVLFPKKQPKTITKDVNLWFKNERSNGFKFWALNRAITTNGDNEVLVKD